MRKILVVLAIFLYINPVFAAKQPEAKTASKSITMPAALSMTEAISVALKNNNELRAMKHSLSAQQREIGIARSYILPKLRFDEVFTSTDMPAMDFALRINQQRFTSSDLDNAPGSFNNPPVINNFLTSVTLIQPIYIRKTYVGLSMAKQEYTAQTYEYCRKQEEVAFNAGKAYLSVMTAQEYVNVAKKAQVDAKEHLRIAQARFNTGLGLYSDVLRASTAVTATEQSIITANKNLQLAKKSLGLLIGEKNPVNISSIVPALYIKNVDYENTALLSRNDIRFMQARLENAKNGIKLAQADYYPLLYGFGSYQLWDHRAPFAAEGHSYLAGAGLNWDLFDGFKRKYEKLKAKDRVAEAQEYLEGLKKLVSFQIYEAKLNIQEAAKRRELAISACKSAEEGRKIVQKRWENSLSPLVDLLDAQLNLDKNRADVIKADNDNKTALLNLNYQSGIILKDLGIE